MSGDADNANIGLLFQVIWEFPEELRRELSRLDSMATLRVFRAQVNLTTSPGYIARQERNANPRNVRQDST